MLPLLPLLLLVVPLPLVVSPLLVVVPPLLVVVPLLLVVVLLLSPLLLLVVPVLLELERLEDLVFRVVAVLVLASLLLASLLLASPPILVLLLSRPSLPPPLPPQEISERTANKATMPLIMRRSVFISRPFCCVVQSDIQLLLVVRQRRSSTFQLLASPSRRDFAGSPIFFRAVKLPFVAIV
ncbi:MAG: hypothetical protein KJ788_09400 [Gammaproteobacteria bacterium]|nr:hypothetical protein [Gammaproteobacteria bacterium]